MKILRRPSSVLNIVYQEQLCSDTPVTNDARFSSETKSSIVMAKVAFNKKKTLFTSKFDSNLRKKPVNF